MTQRSSRKIDSQTEHAVRVFMRRVSDSYDLDEAILFGSRARRDNRPDSDADLAVLLRGRRGAFLDTKPAMANIAYDVLLEIGERIQPFSVWGDDWTHPEHATNPTLVAHIVREGIRL